MSGPALVVAHRLDTADAKTWDALVDQSPLPTPFLRSWWLAAVHGPHTRYLLVREGDDLLGGIALDHRRRLGVGRWSVPGPSKLCPDHLDVVARPDDASTVARLVLEHVASEHSSILDLDGLRADSWIAAAHRAAARPLELEEVERAPFVHLPDTLEQYLRERSKNFRRKSTRVRRRAEADGLVARPVGPDRLPQVLDVFEDLHRARGDREEFLQDFPVVRSAVTSAMEAGEAVVHVAERDGRIGAVAIAFRNGGAVRNYQAARSMSEEFSDAPTLTELSIIDEACQDGLVEFDFLRGSAPYKYSYCDQDRPVMRLRSGTGAGRLVLATRRLAVRLRAVARAVARSSTTQPTPLEEKG